MFRRSDQELLELQRQLLAVEEEDTEEECEEEYEEEFEDTQEDYEEYFESDYEEEYEQEPYCRSHPNRYGRGNPKKFEDDDFFDEDFDDEDVLYQKDYKKAKRKKRRKTFGLLILAILELAAIGGILLWFVSWMQ